MRMQAMIAVPTTEREATNFVTALLQSDRAKLFEALLTKMTPSEIAEHIRFTLLTPEVREVVRNLPNCE